MKTKTDKELFLEAMHDVQPLKRPAKPKPRTLAATPPARSQEHYQRKQQHATGSNPPLTSLHGISDYYSSDGSEQPRHEYLNPLCGTDVLHNLKKGRWPLMHSIDLHGSTLDQARTRLEYFLQHCLAEQFKCVRIVHGVGYGSKGDGPVLPTAVRRWLSQLDFVLAYSDCPPREGGNGAVKVLLRIN